MPRKPHDTTAHEPMQASPAAAEEWATEVVARLPANMQQQARVLKAFERSRQIRSASDLLRGLLAYVYTVHSFQQLPHLESAAGSRRCLSQRLAQTPTTSQHLAHVALARSARGLDSGLALAAASRVATHLAHRWDPFHVPRSSGNGVAGAYRL
jgi:hypothetical protein